MALFRTLLVVLLATLTAYTAVVVSRHGMDFLPIFYGDIAKFGWPGQFNVDFSGFLILSAVWTAWRNRFSPLGLALGVVAFFGGMMFLTIYLLIESLRTKGDVAALLLGPSRAGRG